MKIVLGGLCLAALASAFLVIAAWAPSGSSQSIPPPNRATAKGGASDPLTDPRLVEQLPLQDAADRIQGLVESRDLAGFSGVALKSETDTVSLYWKGALPEAMTDLIDRLPPTINVDIRSARYSLEELLEEAQRIVSTAPAGIGAQITAIGPLDDYSGLRVSVESPGAVGLLRNSVETRVSLRITVHPRAELLDNARSVGSE
jgi:hypothetical protein